MHLVINGLRNFTNFKWHKKMISISYICWLIEFSYIVNQVVLIEVGEQ